MSRLIERDTGTLSDLKPTAGLTDQRAYIQSRDLYLASSGLDAARDKASLYYLYVPELESSVLSIARASSSSIDADPNPLSILLLDDVSQCFASVMSPFMRILVGRGFPPAEAELIDWDVAIEAAPSRPVTTVNVSIEYVGRSKPIPVDDSWE